MRESNGRWVVVVHGGAKTIAREMFELNRAGCAQAADLAAAVVRTGGSAIDAAEAAIRSLEDDPIFNAGFGSVLNADGEVEMDAALMDGTSLAVGAVTGVRRVRNPVRIARAMLDEVPVLLAGDGAERFAAARDIQLCDPQDMISREQRASEHRQAHDTVGCVVLDLDGHFAAGTSTGGLTGKHPGRIGDSPIPGCGLQADDQTGAVALSGDGESIVRSTLASFVMHALERDTAGPAARAAIARLGRVGGEAGVIVLDREGRIGISHNSDNFAVAVHASWLDQPVGGVGGFELKDLLDD